MEDRDTKGDLYEYMLARSPAPDRTDSFRTPRHISSSSWSS